MVRKIGFSKPTSSTRSAPESTSAPAKNTSAPAKSKNGIPKMWSDQLLGKEKILWIGRPEFSASGNARAIFMIVIMIAVTVGVLFFYNGNQFGASGLLSSSGFGGRAWAQNSGIFLPLFVTIFLIGLLRELSQAPFFSRYMLSDQRMYIAKIFPWKRIKSYDLTPTRRIVFDQRPIGNIVFASEMRRVQNSAMREFPIGFMNIKGANKVYATMLDVQQRRAVDSA